MSSRYGRLEQEYRTNFRNGTVPSWCALREAGVADLGCSIAPPSAPGGGIDLVTAAGPSKAAGFIVQRPVDLTTVKLIEMQVWMTGGGDNTTSLFLGVRNASSTRGGGVGRNANNSTVFLRGHAAEVTSKDTTFQAWSGAGIRQSIGYRLFPNEIRAGVACRVSQLLVDEEIFAERTFSGAEFPLDSTLLNGEFTVSGSSLSAGNITRTVHGFEYKEYLR